MVNRDNNGRFVKGHKPQFSASHKARISLAKKGKAFSEEHKNNLSAALKGKKLSEETKRKMSLAQTGREITWSNKISQSMKYRKLSAERRLQMSLDQGGKNVVDSAHYKAVHKWIVEQKGKPLICELCLTTESKRYEWSNITQRYLFNVNDWQRLCKKCHVNYDIKYKKDNHGKLDEIFSAN